MRPTESEFNREEHRPTNGEPTPGGRYYNKRNASEVAEGIAAFWGCSVFQARAGLKLTTDAIVDLTIASRNLMLTGVGAWTIRERAVYCDPFSDRTNATPEIRTFVHFSPSKILTEVLNSPLSRRSIELARVAPENTAQPFERVWTMPLPKTNVLHRVERSGKATLCDLYELMASRGMITERVAQNFMLGLKAVIRETLAERTSVQLSGFGAFKIRDLAPREGRNPHSGEAMIIPARRKIQFKPSDAFRERAAEVGEL